VVAPRQLSRPPITEALVDIRIAADAAIDRTRLEPLCAVLHDQYPKLDEKRQLLTEFRVEAGKMIPPSSRDLGFHGVWLTSSDGTRIAQFRTDGFTLNNVGAYLGGEALIEEALGLWRQFAKIAEPTAVTRLALRYINRLELPFAQEDEFKRFLNAPAELPEEAPQMVSGFLTRVVAQDESGASSIITQKLDGAPLGSPVPVIIDIDVSFSREFEPDPSTLRPFLGTLRTLKNRCFFALLTDEAANLYL